jgi:molecular chaperone HscB
MQFDLTQNFFQLFNLPESFEVDQADLSSRFRELQKVVHPDRFASSSDQERRIAMQQATRINEAYETLKQPVSRARYLLQINGVEMNDETDTSVDPMFLMEQMELREALAEVPEKDEPEAALDKLMQQVNGLQKNIIVELSQCFTSNDEANLKKALETVRKLQFVNKLRQEADELDERLAGY